MPLYEYRCDACEVVTEALRRPDVGAIACHACTGPATRIISLSVVRPDIAPYYDDGLGARVESRGHRRRLMRDRDLVENDKPVVPHGAKGTVFSFPGQASTSVPPSGAFKKS